MDGASKLRLDRRTLYAGLLMEWATTNQLSKKKKNSHQQDNTRNNNAAAVTSFRKFLTTSTSQSLQAALALATQPKWRRSISRPNGLRLYNVVENNNNNDKSSGNNGNSNNGRPCTLAMQETIAMALVRFFCIREALCVCCC